MFITNEKLNLHFKLKYAPIFIIYDKCNKYFKNIRSNIFNTETSLNLKKFAYIMTRKFYFKHALIFKICNKYFKK